MCCSARKWWCRDGVDLAPLLVPILAALRLRLHCTQVYITYAARCHSTNVSHSFPSPLSIVRLARLGSPPSVYSPSLDRVVGHHWKRICVRVSTHVRVKVQHLHSLN